MELRLGIVRTFVEEFTGACQVSAGGCGTTSDLSGFLDGSTSNSAAFRWVRLKISI